MPSTSAKQHNLMEAVSHDPQFAKKVGIPQKVGKDFAAADKAKGRPSDLSEKYVHWSMRGKRSQDV